MPRYLVLLLMGWALGLPMLAQVVDFSQFLAGDQSLPWTTLLSLATLLFGYVVYLLSQRMGQQRKA